MAEVSLRCRELAELASSIGYQILPMLFGSLADTLDSVAESHEMGLDQVVDVLNDVHFLESYRHASDIDDSVADGIDGMGPSRMKLVGDCFAVAAHEVLGKEEGGAL